MEISMQRLSPDGHAISTIEPIVNCFSKLYIIYSMQHWIHVTLLINFGICILR